MGLAMHKGRGVGPTGTVALSGSAGLGGAGGSFTSRPARAVATIARRNGYDAERSGRDRKTATGAWPPSGDKAENDRAIGIPLALYHRPTFTSVNDGARN
jgi:hypothetical protein